MILISQDKSTVVELKTLWWEEFAGVYTIYHKSDGEGASSCQILGKYPTKEVAIAQIEAIAKALEDGKQVYRFD